MSAEQMEAFGVAAWRSGSRTFATVGVDVGSRGAVAGVPGAVSSDAVGEVLELCAHGAAFARKC